MCAQQGALTTSEQFQMQAVGADTVLGALLWMASCFHAALSVLRDFMYNVEGG